ncbi:MAG: TetR/AcrR family transcriptional regulator, partial [Aldersonia sp.]|nr:TetR/AcrR family transcriptional regulator [Aldersonia sp.]
MSEVTHRRSGHTTRGVRLPRGARRAVLLEAAQNVFVANGYHSAAMDDIAERAGVSKPVLYQHFPGKLDLYLALVNTHVDVLVMTLRDALASTNDNKSRIRAAVAAYFDFVDREDQAFRLVFESDLRNEPAVREAVERSERTCAEAIAAVISADAGLDKDQA